MYKTFIIPAFKDLKTFVLDTLFPIYCLVCSKGGSFLCNDCQTKLPLTEGQHCIICQKPSPFGLTHPKCQSPHMPDGLVSFYDYHDERTSDIIISGKYKFVPSLYQILGKMVVDRLSDFNYVNFFQNFSLVPVPLASSRRRWRGFNQAEILCQTLSNHLGLPVEDVLQRHKHTKTQKDLKKEERIKNVANSFKLKKHLSLIPSPRWGGLGRGDEIDSNNLTIYGKNFLLVDDVVTTGSTLTEAAKVLKRNGATQVWCLTVARD